MTKHCETGKVGHSSLSRAKAAAHAFARVLNQEHKLADSLYAYRCPTCKRFHITRQAGWEGNVLVYEAAPEHLQRWAMGESDDVDSPDLR